MFPTEMRILQLQSCQKGSTTCLVLKTTSVSLAFFNQIKKLVFSASPFSHWLNKPEKYFLPLNLHIFIYDFLIEIFEVVVCNSMSILFVVFWLVGFVSFKSILQSSTIGSCFSWKICLNYGNPIDFSSHWIYVHI